MRQACFKRNPRLLVLSSLLAQTRFAFLAKPPPLLPAALGCLFLGSLPLFFRFDQPPPFRLFALTLVHSPTSFLFENNPPLLPDQPLMLHVDTKSLVTYALTHGGMLPLRLITLDGFDKLPERQ